MISLSLGWHLLVTFPVKSIKELMRLTEEFEEVAICDILQN